MILSGKEIKNRMAKGDIIIRPFDEKQLNPNSYNLKLHNELIVYDEPVLDMAKDNAYHKIKIPKEGLVLEPGKLYLGRTMEFTETQNLVPMLEGRSSIGRLGIYIHVTAGFGDVGFEGFWTLEISCVQPVRIYPFVEIGQVYYHTIEGEYESYSKKGKYQCNTDIQTSQIWKEFGGKPNPLNELFKLKKDVDDAILEEKALQDELKKAGQALRAGLEDGLKSIQKLNLTWPMISHNAFPVVGVEFLENDEEPEIFYLCDRRACDTCNPACRHTTDIMHAADFVLDDHGNFWQKERD